MLTSFAVNLVNRVNTRLTAVYLVNDGKRKGVKTAFFLFQFGKLRASYGFRPDRTDTPAVHTDIQVVLGDSEYGGGLVERHGQVEPFGHLLRHLEESVRCQCSWHVFHEDCFLVHGKTTRTSQIK